MRRHPFTTGTQCEMHASLSSARKHKIQILWFRAQCQYYMRARITTRLYQRFVSGHKNVVVRKAEGKSKIVKSIYMNRPRFPPPFVPSLGFPTFEMSKNSGRLSFRFVPPAKVMSRFVDRVLCRVLLCLFCILAALFTASTLRAPGLCEAAAWVVAWAVASEGGSLDGARSLDTVSDMCIWTSLFGKGCAAEKVNMGGRSIPGE